jgi:hypothetical protein
MVDKGCQRSLALELTRLSVRYHILSVQTDSYTLAGEIDFKASNSYDSTFRPSSKLTILSHAVQTDVRDRRQDVPSPQDA